MVLSAILQDKLHPNTTPVCEDAMQRRLHAGRPLLLYGSIVFLFTYAFGLTVVTVEIQQRLGRAEDDLLSIRALMVSSMEVWLSLARLHIYFGLYVFALIMQPKVSMKRDVADVLQERKRRQKEDLSPNGCHCQPLPGKFAC
jgi:hypothetical protein